MPHAFSALIEGLILCTKVLTSAGVVIPAPTRAMLAARSSSSAASTGPISPSPHVPGKKLEPEKISVLLVSTTAQPSFAAAIAAQIPAMPAPITSTSPWSWDETIMWSFSSSGQVLGQRDDTPPRFGVFFLALQGA